MTHTTFARLPDLVGRSFGPSPYVLVDQARIDAVADTTLDPQWIHVDPAHGYLTLSLLVKMVQDLGVLPSDAQLVVNYGLNKVRFPAPVPSGSRVSCRADLKSCEPKGEGRLLLTLACTVEVEGQDAPALVAEVLYLVVA